MHVMGDQFNSSEMNRQMSVSKKLLKKDAQSGKEDREMSIVKMPKPSMTDREEFLKMEISNWLHQLNTKNNVTENLEVLQQIKSTITTSTGFTSIPETLKLLCKYYDNFKKLYAQKADDNVKRHIANIISFIATSNPPNSEGDVLEYYLRGFHDHVKVWGIAYVRGLTKDIVSKFKSKSCGDKSKTIFALVKECTEFFISQNSEIEACDFLIETEQLFLLDSLVVVDENCSKICNYIIACTPYLPEPENKNILYSVLDLSIKYKSYIESLYVALILQDLNIVQKIFYLCNDELIQKQLALILSRFNMSVNLEDVNEDVLELMNNCHLNKHFITVGRQLDVLAPKAPSDIHKSKNVSSLLALDTEASVVGSTFLNCFINAAFSNDKLVLTDKSMNWICRHKDIGKVSATASMGVICLWDVDGGLNKIDKYLYSKDVYIKAGALLAFGIVNCTIKSEFEPAYLLLSEHVSSDSEPVQLSSIVGIALAYVGTNHHNAIDSIIKVIHDEKSPMFTIGIASISCGLVASSSLNGHVISTLIEYLSNKNLKLSTKTTRNIIHAIGLCVMGKPNHVSMLSSVSEVIKSKYVRQYLKICIEVCAYVGSSNILKIQELIKVCTEMEIKKMNGKKSQKTDKSSEICCEDLIKMISVIGIGLISLGNDLNSEMVIRIFGHFLRSGDSFMIIAVILSISLIYLSKPQMNIVELLSKHSHSHNQNIAFNAILALGFVSAGTNNAKVSKLLMNLTNYYCHKPKCLFSVKVAQGLLHLGKGTLTLSCQMEKTLLRHTSISGILIVLLQLFDPDDLINEHYYLFFLSCAIRPKMLLTLDSNMNAISTMVRVGQFVDTIGQAGKPRSITGFQTNTTPVLLDRNEKAELVSDEYIALNNNLVGSVILKPNTNVQQK